MSYTFEFLADFGGILRPYVFRSDLPGTGTLNQAAMGKAYGTALGSQLPEPEMMNVGLNDWYGRPVFSDLILQRDKNDSDRIEMINALITVTQKKNIIQTSVTGRPGSVIEYVSMPGYDITIDGLLIGDEYPRQQAEALIRILNEAQSLQVISEYLAMFSVYNVVVKKYDFYQNQKQTTQKFKLILISDEQLELTIE